MDNWPYDLNGSLILIALDHNTNLCDVKIIDSAMSTGNRNDAAEFADGIDQIVSIL